MIYLYFQLYNKYIQINTLIFNITYILKYYHIISLLLYDIIYIIIAILHAIEMLVYNKKKTGPYSEATL